MAFEVATHNCHHGTLAVLNINGNNSASLRIPVSLSDLIVEGRTRTAQLSATKDCIKKLTTVCIVSH